MPLGLALPAATTRLGSSRGARLEHFAGGILTPSVRSSLAADTGKHWLPIHLPSRRCTTKPALSTGRQSYLLPACGEGRVHEWVAEGYMNSTWRLGSWHFLSATMRLRGQAPVHIAGPEAML